MWCSDRQHSLKNSLLLVVFALCIHKAVSKDFELDPITFPLNDYNNNFIARTAADPFSQSKDVEDLLCGKQSYKHPISKLQKPSINIIKQCYPHNRRIVIGTKMKSILDKQTKSGCHSVVTCSVAAVPCPTALVGLVQLTEDMNCKAPAKPPRDARIIPRYGSSKLADIPDTTVRYFYPVNRFKDETEANKGSLHLYGGNEKATLDTITNQNTCGWECKTGVMTYKYKKDTEIYMRLHLTDKCNTVKICFNMLNNMCNKQTTMTIFVKNGIVILPNEAFGHSLIMDSDTPGLNIVNLGWGNTKAGKFYVSNINYEVVTGAKSALPTFNAAATDYSVTVVLDNDQCVHDFGITGNYADGKQNSKTPETATVPVIPVTTPIVTIDGTVTAAVPLTTTSVPQFVVSTTAPPVTVQQSSFLSGSGGKKTIGSVTGEGGWLTWALFYGFVAGIVATGIASAIFLFIFRRSAYSEWYRGMYKRYGCDASGTTGGVTGAAFGNTTTGAQTMTSTIGAMNTGKTMTTTAGTTGATTGGTTGGDTLAL